MSFSSAADRDLAQPLLSVTNDDYGAAERTEGEGDGYVDFDDVDDDDDDDTISPLARKLDAYSRRIRASSAGSGGGKVRLSMTGMGPWPRVARALGMWPGESSWSEVLCVVLIVFYAALFVAGTFVGSNLLWAVESRSEYKVQYPATVAFAALLVNASLFVAMRSFTLRLPMRPPLTERGEDASPKLLSVLATRKPCAVDAEQHFQARPVDIPGTLGELRAVVSQNAVKNADRAINGVLIILFLGLAGWGIVRVVVNLVGGWSLLQLLGWMGLTMFAVGGMVPSWLPAVVLFALYVSVIVLLSQVMDEANAFSTEQLRIVVVEGQVSSTTPRDKLLARLHQIERSRALAQYLCSAIGSHWGIVIIVAGMIDLFLFFGFMLSVLTGGAPPGFSLYQEGGVLAAATIALLGMIWLPAGLLAGRDKLDQSLEEAHRALPASETQLRDAVESLRMHVAQGKIGISVLGVLLTPTLAKTATLTFVSVVTLVVQRLVPLLLGEKKG